MKIFFGHLSCKLKTDISVDTEKHLLGVGGDQNTSQVLDCKSKKINWGKNLQKADISKPKQLNKKYLHG